MEEVGRRQPPRSRPENDNRPPNGQSFGSEADTFQKLDAMVLTIAGLIGRGMARRIEKAMRAANDKAPLAPEDTGPEVDDED